MKTTIILTPKQAKMLLNNLPTGHQIKLSVADANRIIDNTGNFTQLNKNHKQ